MQKYAISWRTIKWPIRYLQVPQVQRWLYDCIEHMKLENASKYPVDIKKFNKKKSKKQKESKDESLDENKSNENKSDENKSNE